MKLGYIMNDKNENSIELECPHCSKDNTIKLLDDIKCNHCNKKLIGYKYKSVIMSAMTAIILGAGGTYFIKEKFEENRYPISIEHEIISSCISSDRTVLEKNHYRKKELICICALDKTQEELNYNDYQEKGNAFYSIFEKKAKECLR